MDVSAPISMLTESRDRCCLCDSAGQRLHAGLKDHLYAAPGIWSFSQCSNRNCGLVWLDPMPLAGEIHKAYAQYSTHSDLPDPPVSRLRSWLRLGQNYLAWRYGYTVEDNRKWTRAIGWLVSLHPTASAALDLAVFHLRSVPGGRLLEVGCGSGKMLLAMKMRGWDVEGVDPDPAAVENSRAKGLTVRLGTLDQQSYTEAGFDAIVMCHVIEHVSAPIDLMRECGRLLRPGGSLVVVTPNSNSLGHSHYGQYWRGLEPPRHLHIFNPLAMRQLVRTAGFADFSLTTTVRDADNLFIASERIRGVARGRNRAPGRWAFGRAKAMQLLEWTILNVLPEKGEEMILIARK